MNYLMDLAIGLMSRVSVNDPGDWGLIPGRVIPKDFKNSTRYRLS